MKKIILISALLISNTVIAQSVEQVGVCAGALTIEFQRGDKATASKYYAKMKNQIDSYDATIKKQCPSGINEACFNSLPLEARQFINIRGKTIKELNSPSPTTLVKNSPPGNDPATRGIVLMGNCN